MDAAKEEQVMGTFRVRSIEEMGANIAAALIVLAVFALVMYQMFDLVTTLNGWREGNFISVGFRDGLRAGLDATFAFLVPLLKSAWMWVWQHGTELMVNLGFSRRTAEITVASAGLLTYCVFGGWLILRIWRYASRNSGF